MSDFYFFSSHIFSRQFTQFFWVGVQNSKNHFWQIFLPFYAILNNFEFFHFWPTFVCTTSNYFIFLFGGGQTLCLTNFSPFHGILNNFDFFTFDQNFLYDLQFFIFLGGGPKIIFDEFSRHFTEFWTTLIFSLLTNIFLYDLQFLGGRPTIIFDEFSRHFMEFWTTLIFSLLTKFFVRPLILLTNVPANLDNFEQLNFWFKFISILTF